MIIWSVGSLQYNTFRATSPKSPLTHPRRLLGFLQIRSLSRNFSHGTKSRTGVHNGTNKGFTGNEASSWR